MKKYERWSVDGYRRPELAVSSDGQAVPTGGWEQVAVISDPASDREWHVTVEKDATTGLPVITSLMIRGGGPIDKQALRETTTTYLAEAAWGFWAQVQAERVEGAALDEALATSGSQPGQVRMTNEETSMVEQVAAVWNATDPLRIVDGKRIGRRQAVAEHFHLSVWSIDKYVARARKDGLIEKAPTKTPTSKPARRSSTK